MLLQLRVIKATDRSSGWTKSPARYRETWWWNDVINSVIEKWKLWKKWKQGNTSKEKAFEQFALDRNRLP